MYNSQIESRYSYKMVAQNTVLTSEVNYVKGICLHRQQLQILNHFQEKSDSFNTRAIFLIYHLIQVPWIGYSNGRFGRCDINQQTNFPQLQVSRIKVSDPDFVARIRVLQNIGFGRCSDPDPENVQPSTLCFNIQRNHTKNYGK